MLWEKIKELEGDLATALRGPRHGEWKWLTQTASTTKPRRATSDASATFQQLIEFLRKAEEDARALASRRLIAHDDSGTLQWKTIARNFHRAQKVVTEAHDRENQIIGRLCPNLTLTPSSTPTS